MKDFKRLLTISLVLFFCACSSGTSNNNNEDSFSTSSDIEESSIEEDSEGISDEDTETVRTFDDGTYTATVNYFNPNTGTQSTYSLDVEVVDNYVVQINFPNGGWLDDDHMTPAELDEDGFCTIETEDGLTYEIQIES